MLPQGQPQDPCINGSLNLQTLNSNEIHVWRMRVAVLWSIILQFVLLLIFIIFVNLNIFHPLTWFANCFYVFVSADVWIKLVILVGVIYIQGEVCKKDYVMGPVYHTTRIHKIRNIFSVRNLLLLLLHMVIGITIFWIYISLFGKAYQSLTKQCRLNANIKGEDKCLNESKLFLLVGGLWLGMYYFAHDYIFGSRNLSFPLIQQYKFYRIKSALKDNIKNSVKYSLIPTGLFLCIYYVYGGLIRIKSMEVLSLELDVSAIDSIQGLMNIHLIFSLWLFSSIFIVALQMMELIFNVYLTEHYTFPITSSSSAGNNINLLDALKNVNVPIMHHLGYLDLFTFSMKSQQRREKVFTLSHPGGHPHTWNGIFHESTALIKKFTNDLNQALQQTSTGNEKEVKTSGFKSPPNIGSFHFHSHNIRRLASPINNKDISNVGPTSGVEVAFNNLQHWLHLKLEQVYKKPFIAYFIEESPDSRINYLLCQSQPVIWAVQSLAFLSAASLSEDRYGIVQKDLTEIIVTIVNLKQILDKLFKQNLIVKKSFGNDPLEVQMKYILKASVKRSLYKLSVSFLPYIRDFRLPIDVELQINNFIAFKEVL